MSTPAREVDVPAVREVGWEEFWEEQPPSPGVHVSVFGPTGSGKTYTLVSLAEMFPGHAVLVVTKGADELVDRLVKERDWQRAEDAGDILTDNGGEGKLLKRTWNDRYEKRQRPPQKIVFQPQVPSGSVRMRKDFLATQVEDLIDRAYEYCRRSPKNRMMVAIDETMYAAMELRLGDVFTVIWNEGRSLGLAFVAAMQRPAWIPKSSKSAPTFLVIFPTTDPEDLAELSKMAGYRRSAEFREVLEGLGEHEHVLVVTRGRGRHIYRSRVVIRKRGRVDGGAKQ